jgi:hypothetical protein
MSWYDDLAENCQACRERQSHFQISNCINNGHAGMSCPFKIKEQYVSLTMSELLTIAGYIIDSDSSYVAHEVLIDDAEELLVVLKLKQDFQPISITVPTEIFENKYRNQVWIKK